MATDRPKNQELTILKAAIDGDRSAIASIYEAHIGYLTSVCSRYIADDEDVKDILQESFIKIFRSLGITKDSFLTELKKVKTDRVTSDEPENTYDALSKYGFDLVQRAGTIPDCLQPLRLPADEPQGDCGCPRHGPGNLCLMPAQGEKYVGKTCKRI